MFADPFATGALAVVVLFAGFAALFTSIRFGMRLDALEVAVKRFNQRIAYEAWNAAPDAVVGSAMEDRADVRPTAAARVAAAPEVAVPVAAATIEAPQPPPPPISKAPAIDWELFAGGRLLNVIGAIVLVIGAGMLLKYAWDENWVSIPLRIAAGIVAGIALLAGGHVAHVRARTRWFEQGLFGAGIGVLYVTGYSAFAGYQVFPFGIAYAFMSVVTIVALVMSVKYESLPMALIGWAGGFATPFAISDGTGNALALASYIVLLDVGLLSVSLARRSWSGFQPLAVIASYVAASAWYAVHAASVTNEAATISLVSMWLVFFVSSVAESLTNRAIPNGATWLKRASAIGNGIVFWAFVHQVLQSEARTLAALTFVASTGYAIAYAVFVRRFPAAYFERAQYGGGAAVLFGAGAFIAFDALTAATAIALGATLLAALAFVRDRVNLATAHTTRECTFASYGLFAAAVWIVGLVPDVATYRNGAWSLGFGGRDLTFVIAIIGATSIDRLGRVAKLGDAPGFILRHCALGVCALLQADHLSGFALAEAYAADAFALVLGVTMLRGIGANYAADVEARIDGLVFVAGAIFAFASVPGAFAFVDGVGGAVFAARDLALLSIAGTAFAIDRIIRRSTHADASGAISRQIAVASIFVFELVHACGFGLATAFGLEAIALVAIDRILEKCGDRYADGNETGIVASILAAAGWIAFFASPGATQFVDTRLWLGFGGVDAALVVLGCAALAVERAYRRSFAATALATLRLGVLAAIAVATCLHFAGSHLAVALSFEAIGLALVGTRTMFREIEFVGFAALASAIAVLLATPGTWAVGVDAHLVPFHDGRFFAALLCSLATVLAGEIYRRRSTLPPWPALGARLAGIALATFGCTIEVRDWFELAIVRAVHDPTLVLRLSNSEGLGISGVWIAVSIVLVAAGLRLRIREFRIAAIALFDLTILKAFFIDLGSLATPYRIVSFIGLGLVLLGVSFAYQRLERSFFDRPPAIDDFVSAEAA